MAVKPIPEGYRTVTPYLVLKDAQSVIDLLKKAFGAEEIMRVPGPRGGISHAELRLGDSMVMMGESADASHHTRSLTHLYVPDVDDAYKRAIAAGAASVIEPHKEFYGDRVASVRDSSGNQWYMATHVEDVSGEELARRAAEREKQPA